MCVGDGSVLCLAHQLSRSPGTPGAADLWWGSQGSHGESLAHGSWDRQRFLGKGVKVCIIAHLVSSGLNSSTFGCRLKWQGVYVLCSWEVCSFLDYNFNKQSIKMPVNSTYSNDLFPSRGTLHLLNEKYYSTLCQNRKFKQTASHLSNHFRWGGMEKT